MICECCGQFKKINIKHACESGEFSLDAFNDTAMTIKFPFDARVGVLDISTDTAKGFLVLLREWESRLERPAT
jgi:hypothetical protein